MQSPLQLLAIEPSCTINSYMKLDGRLSAVLHLLLHLAQQDAPVTSAVLAKAIATHAVVIRRILAGSRTYGYVRSEKGHGGGWVLACDPAKLTLRDVYSALGNPTIFAMGNRNLAPSCLVEQVVNAALRQTFEEAEQLLLKRFGDVTLAMLTADLRRHVAARGRSRQQRTGSIHACGALKHRSQ